MGWDLLRRRKVLSSLVAGGMTLAGCSGQDDETPSDQDDQSGGTPLNQDDQSTADSVQERTEYIVSTGGDDSNRGSDDQPLATIHEGLQRAGPGDTVKIKPGEYFEEHAPGEQLRTVRDGEANAPITITGPEEAILRPGFRIKHSHIRLEGLTLEGVLDPDAIDDPDSYVTYCVDVRPFADADEGKYLEDIVVAPAAVGYAPNALIRVIKTKNIEIGPLRVTGLAGASWILPDEPDRHAGEIVYLGSPLTAVIDSHAREVDYPWANELDETRDVHIHHIDNSEGYPHSQLVDAKAGTRNILIEYCTDAGGSQNTETYPVNSLALRSYNTTVRWCDLRDGEGDGIQINSGARNALRDVENPVVPLGKFGTGNEIYGNRIRGFDNLDLVFHTGHPDPDERDYETVGPDDQSILCNNELSGTYERRINYTDIKQIDFDAGASCPSDVPKGDGIGHTGGNSPGTY